ncbi:MAG TPA: hypothetical protein VFT41_11335 [Gemmatimonadaceae bacterium]|nr:hypothetical protein [Gemmatimonadaceae bacterium]
MSRLSNPGCMLRALSALFGTIFLPIGISFFFVLRHAHWREGVGAVLASFAFFYVAWRANDILGLDDIGGATDVSLPTFALPPRDAPATPPPDEEPPS